MTASEWNRWYKLEEQMDELKDEMDAIYYALDHLRDYVD